MDYTEMPHRIQALEKRLDALTQSVNWAINKVMELSNRLWYLERRFEERGEDHEAQGFERRARGDN